MAKRPRRSRHDEYRRDVYDSIARTLPDPRQEVLVRVLPDLPINNPSRSPVDLTEVEDYRVFTPDPVRTAKSSRRSVVRLQLAPAPGRPVSGRPFSDVQALMFRQPKHVLVCVRRKSRREVLMALGKGGRGNRRGRRSYWSDVRC